MILAYQKRRLEVIQLETLLQYSMYIIDNVIEIYVGLYLIKMHLKFGTRR